MGIFRKLLGSRKPAPSYEIHQNDKELIRKEDKEWWGTLTMDELKEIEKQDNASRMAAYMHFTTTNGMSKEDATKEIKKTIPVYYLTPNQRGDKDLLEDDDANLPYILKKRINDTIISRIAYESLNKEGTHIHDLIRGLLRTC
jgi:hypothetical protein